MAQTQPEGYLALPATGEGDGVLVLHAWWGLNDTMKAFCNRLAESGFVAFAPDLYHGKVAATIPDAEALGAALDARADQAKAEIADAVKFLRERAGQGGRGLAVIGFSLGAYYALGSLGHRSRTRRVRRALLRDRARRLQRFASSLPRSLRGERSVRAAIQRRVVGGRAQARGPPGDLLSLSRLRALVLRAGPAGCLQ